MSEKAKEKSQAIINLYHKYGKSDYIGEKVTQIEHAIQSAFYTEAFVECASKTGELKNIIQDVSINNIGLSTGSEYINEIQKSSIICGALLHDIGHLLYFEDSTIALMGTIGVKNHEDLGALYLKKIGFNNLVVYLVNSHVNAKRYLITCYPKYKDSLSKASLLTLEHQGGCMTSEELQEFESKPNYKFALIVRIADDYAKLENSKLENMSYYKDFLTECIDR